MVALARRGILQPLLLAVYYPLLIHASNIEQSSVEDILVTALIFAAYVGLLMGVCYALTRDWEKTGLTVCGLVVLSFFTFPDVVRWVGAFLGARSASDPYSWLLLAAWIVVAAAYAISVARLRSRQRLNVMWTTAVVALTCMPTVTVAKFVLLEAAPSSARYLAGPIPLRPRGPLPDIYYVIFDRYGSEETLRRQYNFSNSETRTYLIEKGFYVAEHSTANYLNTSLSLASSLNLQYLDHFGTELAASSDWRPLFAMLQEHRLWQSLRAIGYEFVNMGSFWDPTRRNRYAHINLSFAPFPQAFHLLYAESVYLPLGGHFGILDSRREQWNRVTRQVEALAEVRRRDKPVFVFVHFLLPHPPYVFGPNGEFLTQREVADRSEQENYVNQVRFTNTIMMRLTDALLSASVKPAPIIVLQADEGPFPPRYARAQDAFDWRTATSDELREKMGILYAVNLAGRSTRALYPTITPVNTFRLIFREYFGADTELLEDRNIAFVSQRHPYEFIDVTSTVQAPPGSRAQSR